MNMAEIIVPGFKGRICGRTSQMFTIGCNSSGEAPETVAVVRPDGEHKVKLKRLCLQLLDKSLRCCEYLHCRFHGAPGAEKKWRWHF